MESEYKTKEEAIQSAIDTSGLLRVLPKRKALNRHLEIKFFRTIESARNFGATEKDLSVIPKPYGGKYNDSK